MTSSGQEKRKDIEQYEHLSKTRVNNPPVGLVTPQTDPDRGQKKTYAYDPHLDPQLMWSGKAEHTSFEVPTVSLHVHERIDPRTLIEAVRKRNGESPRQLSLFESERQEPLRQAVEFYKHAHGWSNRLIAGDSLLVMNSLLEKEGMAGQVQMIYIDPPYGIKYGSNFQPFVNKRDVRDGKDEDLTAEPEQIKAFRDTWELGIHSYLTYLRDRLLLARELLSETGSIFVQIGDENVHLVRCLMDEVFGAGNFFAFITFRKGMPLGNIQLSGVCDYLVWYAKARASVKFRRLFTERALLDDASYSHVEESGGVVRPVSLEERIAGRVHGSGRILTTQPMISAGRTPSCVFDVTVGHRVFSPPGNKSWKTNPEGMQRLLRVDRTRVFEDGLRYILYFDDYPVKAITNLWFDTVGAGDKVYAVQTSPMVIQRCLLVTTDPGDLVLDPTCGSGTTAYVAEKWGRRWITCDTSRVAITLAKQRLMTAVFDYYELAHPEEGVDSGFKYKTVPHVTLRSIANNPEIDGIYARMHPAVEQAVADLNAALKGHPVKLKVAQGGRAGQTVDFAAPDGQTFRMPSGQEAPVNALLEWEVPFEFPDNWPEDARQPFEAFHAARRAMQKEMDAAIARHADQEALYDQPYVDRKKVRVSGPFTVEAVPAPAVKSIEETLTQTLSHGERALAADASVARSGETLRQAEWRDELLRTGIRGKNGQYIRFSRLEPLPGCRWLHAEGETRPSDEGGRTIREEGTAYAPQRVVVSFGPEHAPLEQRQVERAIEEAETLVPRPKLVVFAAFQFDPEAAKDIDQTNWPGVTLLKVQMNADLLTDDLKKKRASNESFWLIGQPDVRLERIDEGEHKGKYRVTVEGFDYYNTVTGDIESGGRDRIAVWLLDTDYDGRSLFPRQVFFPMAGDDEGWARLAHNLKAEIDQDLIEAYRGTESLPFEPGEHRRIAVKIVDDRGIESLRILEVD